MSYYSYLNSIVLKTALKYSFFFFFFFFSLGFRLDVSFFFFFSVVKCPAITTPTHGQIFPTQCKFASGVNYGTHCSFMCNVSVGYRLQGPRNVSCRVNGSWSGDTTKIICKGKNFILCLAFSGSADGQ